MASPIPRLPPVTSTDLLTSPPHVVGRTNAIATRPDLRPRGCPLQWWLLPWCTRGEATTREDLPARGDGRQATGSWRGDLGAVRPARAAGARGGRRVSGGSAVFEAEADLHTDLVVVDLVVDQVTADLGDLEPVEVPQGLAGPGEAVGDRLVQALLGRTNDLRDPVGAIAHETNLSILAAPGRTARRTVVLVEEDRCRDVVSGPAKPSFR